jgi:hypothetical protein
MTWVVGIGIGQFLLFNFPRQTFAFVGVLTVAAYTLYSHLQEATQRDRENEAGALALVATRASGNQAVCNDPRRPVMVEVTNNSPNGTLAWVRFDLAAYKPGFSNVVLNAYSLSSDRILGPGESYTGCWALDIYNKPPEGYTYETLRWEVRKTSASWR